MLYKPGQTVVERLGAGPNAVSTIVKIKSAYGDIVRTTSDNEYNYLTGMRVNKNQPYRSIRQLNEQEVKAASGAVPHAPKEGASL